MLELIRTSRIACISLNDNPRLTTFPSSFGLQVLSLNHCLSLKQIGDYPNLRTLRLSDCLRLERIGKLESLQNLSLESPTSKSVLPLEIFSLSFLWNKFRSYVWGTSQRAFFPLPDLCYCTTPVLIALR
jgi:hypothetical protein